MTGSLFDSSRLSVVKGDDESYQHAAARSVVAHWINEIEATADGTTVIFDLPRYRYSWEEYWRRNRGALIEVPVTVKCMNEASKWGTSSVYAWDERGFEGVPTRQQLLDAGYVVAMIFDIAVYHKGNIKFAIEVCHRHPVDERKEGLIKQYGVPVYEMEADWILRQVRRPARLRAVRAWNIPEPDEGR